MTMHPDPATAVAEIKALRDMTVTEIRRRYEEVVGKPTRSRNGPALRGTVARRLAEQAREIASSPAERRRIQRALTEATTHRAAPTPIPHDPRIPAVGSVLKKRHGDQVIEVKVTRSGFTFRGRAYRSLSAIAREVTGARWNGLLWFGLRPRQRRRRSP